MTHSFWKSIAFGALVAIAIGCEGQIDITAHDPDSLQPGSGGEVEGIERPGGGEMDDVCRFINTDDDPLKRLTEDEYNRVVRDLFPGASFDRQTFAADEKVAGFDANILAAVDKLVAEQYQGAAETIATQVANDFGTISDCSDTSDTACTKAFIDDVAARAFRRPLTDEEKARFTAFYDAQASTHGDDAALRMSLEVILQHPEFLYRGDFVDGDEPVAALDDFQVAHRLSFFLWGSIPDEALLEAARAGELSENPDAVASHARRMLQDARARETLNDVALKWLRMDDFHTISKEDEAFTPELQASMEAETRAFIDHVLWEGDGTLHTFSPPITPSSMPKLRPCTASKSPRKMVLRVSASDQIAPVS